MKTDKKYLYLPKTYWRKHDQCESLVRQIEDFITNKSYDKLRYKTFKIDSDETIDNTEHILDFLTRTKRTKEHDEIIRNHIINALLIDTCYFLQEALESSKKRRLTVTFSLLRKPFVYILPVFLRLIFDESFLTKFNYEESFDANHLTANEKKKLINESLPLLIGAKSLTSEEIYDWIFNQSISDSLINISNKALHLSTTRNDNNKTEMQNFNFVFSTLEDIENLWTFLYLKLPLILLYLVEVIEVLVFNTLEIPKELFIKRIEERTLILKMK